MSVNWLSKAWVTTTGSAARKAVLIALADRCGEDGVCWPSYRDIEERTELSRNTVRRCIEELQVLGLIGADARTRDNGSTTSNSYKLLIDEISGGHAHGGHPPVPQWAPPMPMVGTPEPVLELSVGTGTAARSQDDRAERPTLRLVSPDDDTPVRGEQDTPPAKKKAAAKKKPAAKGKPRPRYKSPEYQVAESLKEQLEAVDIPASVNIPALTKQFKTLIEKEDYSLSDLRKMIELFVKANSRYTHGDKAQWLHFLTARERLLADTKKISRANTPADQVYGTVDPYAEDYTGMSQDEIDRLYGSVDPYAESS